MDQSEDQTLKISKYQFLKRTLQFVFSVSIFCYFVWHSSGFSIHPQSFNAYFSTCLFSMFTHTLERKYMFLICNGILAYLAKTSLTNSSPSISDFDMEFQEASNLSETKVPVSDIVVVPLESSESPENVPLMAEEQAEKQKECYEEVLEAAEEQEDETLHTETERKENEAYIAEKEEIEGRDEEGELEGGTESGVKVAEDDEVADTTMTTNEELAITDELNRKFEEFIRKMKEEIRIEAQRQLIAV